ncbi:tetratricopeptide repeat protein [Leptospira venezuelensis]|uniref:tetratricopeptide repeat protein n=1 Tax=Leptospira venezuelensis TaxID=1958811 RepID=UPI000A3769E7|nr:tetratricopeptide repeat protein [Leptospira venezuelensis]
MKITFKTALLCISLLMVSGLSSEDDSVQSQIRSLINFGKYQEAGEILKPLLENNPTDVTLGLFQTEIWIGIGENLYQKKQYKSAFPYFSKAFEAWPSHPLLRSRYEELKGKKLVDQIKVEAQPKVGKLSLESQTKNTLIVLADPEILELTNQLKDKLKFRITELEQNTVVADERVEILNVPQKWTLALLGISLFTNLLLSVLLFRKR